MMGESVEESSDEEEAKDPSSQSVVDTIILKEVSAVQKNQPEP